MRALRIVYSLCFWAFFVLSCPFFFVGSLLIVALTWPFDRARVVLHLYSCFWAQVYFYVNPLWRMRVDGREKLPWKGAAILVANHQSLGDILVVYGLYRPFKWVSKASVFRAPFLGWNMWLNGYVPLIRGDKESIAKMFDACEAWLKRGVPVLLFPEGTRSPDGGLQAFKDGAFRLAVARNCPVYPVVLTGTREVLPKQGFVLERSARCQVRVLPPLLPADFGGNMAALRDATRAVFVEALTEGKR